MKILILALVAGLAAPWLAADTASPLGLWRTIDDETGKARSFVRISEEGGVLSGRVERIVDPKRQDAVCEKCKDDRQGQRVLGMEIIRDVRADDDGDSWEGGEILDPTKGKTYRVKLDLEDNGQKLKVRGFVGVSLFGRTQVWERVE